VAQIEFRTHQSIAELGPERWRRLAEGAPPPLDYRWLAALESTGCVEPSRGWLPMHVGAYQDGELVGGSPGYIKGNSEGEFVFDHGWARFAEASLGLEYFPKWIVAVPFTPATGPRFLTAPGADAAELERAWAQALPRFAEKLGVSGVHVLFPEPAQADLLEQSGLLRRYGVQFHWRNPGYATLDDFLARFNSKKRNQIRREIREMRDQALELDVLTGKDLRPEAVDHIFEFYVSTVDKFFYGRRYLNRAFFEQVCSVMPERLHVVFARPMGQEVPIAGAFNLLGHDTLYGRYWGAREDRPFLHFNVCFYRGIEDAIARKLAVFEPGAGGEHKLARGFEPTLTHSAHAFTDQRLSRAIADHLARERVAIDAHVAEAKREGVLKPA
jgi:hypothetical protein